MRHPVRRPTTRPAPRLAWAAGALLGGLALGAPALAQDVTPPGFHLPALRNVTPLTPAKQLFGRQSVPAALPQQAIGFYSKGCLAGATELPPTGATWQVMRPSRNRNYGTGELVRVIERISAKVAHTTGWPGILIGDMTQPRGGPMINGHASHQIGLDADIWLKPMPDHVLTRSERESTMSTMVVSADRTDVDPDKWTPDHIAVLRAAAEQPEVTRIFVNPAIKKALCRETTGDRAWLTKIRPMWGHDYHFHMRIACPAGMALCKPQAPPPPGEGCAPADLAFWFRPGVLHPQPPKPGKVPAKPPRQMTLADMPAPCRAVLAAPAVAQSQ